jgi:hypothetical protein
MTSRKIVQTRLVHLWTRYQVLMVDAAVMGEGGALAGADWGKLNIIANNIDSRNQILTTARQRGTDGAA